MWSPRCLNMRIYVPAQIIKQYLSRHITLERRCTGVVTTSKRQNDVATKSFWRRVPCASCVGKITSGWIKFLMALIKKSQPKNAWIRSRIFPYTVIVCLYMEVICPNTEIYGIVFRRFSGSEFSRNCILSLKRERFSWFSLWKTLMLLQTRFIKESVIHNLACGRRYCFCKHALKRERFSWFSLWKTLLLLQTRFIKWLIYWSSAVNRLCHVFSLLFAIWCKLLRHIKWNKIFGNYLH